MHTITQTHTQTIIIACICSQHPVHMQDALGVPPSVSLYAYDDIQKQISGANFPRKEPQQEATSSVTNLNTSARMNCKKSVKIQVNRQAAARFEASLSVLWSQAKERPHQKSFVHNTQAGNFPNSGIRLEFLLLKHVLTLLDPESSDAIHVDKFACMPSLVHDVPQQLTNNPAYKQSSLQTIQLTNNPAYKQSSLQTIQLTNNPAYKQSSLQTIQLTNNPAYKQSSLQTIQLTNNPKSSS